MSDTSQLPAAQTPLKDLRQSALRHYDEISTAAHVWHSVIPKAINFYFDNAYQCDACGKIVPADEVKSALPAAGVEGTFCHECRHGKNCDCHAA